MSEECEPWFPALGDLQERARDALRCYPYLASDWRFGTLLSDLASLDLDDLAIVAEVRARDLADDGTRMTLDELFKRHGFDRATLEAQIAAEAENSQSGPQ